MRVDQITPAPFVKQLLQEALEGRAWVLSADDVKFFEDGEVAEATFRIQRRALLEPPAAEDH